MNIRLSLIITFLFISLSVSDLYSYKESDTDKLYCFKYDLRAGDTLYYRVVAYDSVIIDFDEPLMRTRFERIKISVDSVINGRIHLTHELDEFIAKESKGDIRDVQRDNAPWVNNKILLTIDTLGNRYAQSIVNPQSFGLAPGGAFQPYLFFPIKESCKKHNESWLVQSVDTLAENGLPYPLMDQTSMMRVEGSIDTLGYEGKKFRYVKTAQAFYYRLTPQDTTEVFARINSGGHITFSNVLNIPIHYFATIEQKLTITYSDGKEIPGWHFISADFTLERIIRKDEITN